MIPTIVLTILYVILFFGFFILQSKTTRLLKQMESLAFEMTIIRKGIHEEIENFQDLFEDALEKKGRQINLVFKGDFRESTGEE